MISKLIDFFIDGIIKFVFKLPVNPFSNATQYIAALQDFLGDLNYFVPFYAMKPIFNVWLAMVSVAVGVYLTIRILLKGV